MNGSARRHLFAYCVGFGVLATVVATVASFAATGIARIELWIAALGSVSVLAGLAYGSGPLNPARLARQAAQWAHHHDA
jgi:hypothetical protein